MWNSSVKHILRSVAFYRITAFYLVAGVVLATVHSPISLIPRPATPLMRQASTNCDASKTIFPLQFRWTLGDPPVSVFHAARIAVAGWFAFLGAFWDVRRRMKEWALVRLYGGYPSLVAAFQYFCLSLCGTLIGGGLSILTGPAWARANALGVMTATLIWGFIFSCCVTIGPILYAEFYDLIPIFRIEGEIR